MAYNILKSEHYELIKIDNEDGFVVTLCNIGASIRSIIFNKKEMLLTPKHMDDFIKPNLYYGKNIGPITNRVRDGIVTIGRKSYQMETNEGKNTLHSASNGISNKEFSYTISENYETFEIQFLYCKSAFEDGLPGNVTYKIKYTISKTRPSFKLDFDVTSDKDTVIAMTNHSYFSLGNNNIHRLLLTIPSDEFINPNHKDLIALSKAPVKRTMSFNKPKLIMKDISRNYLMNSRTRGYDHCYLLKKGTINLEDKEILLSINTDFEAVQIYTDNYKDDIEMTTTNMLTHRGVAIEPQDSLLNRKVLKAKHHYWRFITYTFANK